MPANNRHHKRGGFFHPPLQPSTFKPLSVIRLGGGGGSGPTPLPSVTGLTVVLVDLEADLSWDAVENSAGYVVSAIGVGTGTTSVTLGNVTSHSFTGLAVDTYSFSVKALAGSDADHTDSIATVIGPYDVTAPPILFTRGGSTQPTGTGMLAWGHSDISAGFMVVLAAIYGTVVDPTCTVGGVTLPLLENVTANIVAGSPRQIGVFAGPIPASTGTTHTVTVNTTGGITAGESYLVTNDDLMITFPETPTNVQGATELSLSMPVMAGDLVIIGANARATSLTVQQPAGFQSDRAYNGGSNVSSSFGAYLADGGETIDVDVVTNAVDNVALLALALRGSPATVPAAPTNVIGTAGDGAVVVAFDSPSDGGSAITNYTVTSNPDDITATGSSSPITIDGLSNGTEYTFAVSAVNDVGSGKPGLSGAITPKSVSDGGSYTHWIPKADSPSSMYGATAMTASDGKIYAYNSALTAYDPSTDTWTSRATPIVARVYAGTAIVGDTIYVFGGRSGSSDVATAERYDIATDAWTSIASMPDAVEATGCAAGSDGKIYVIGGYSTSSSNGSSSVRVYDPASDAWSTAPNVPFNPSNIGTSAILIGTDIWAFSGNKAYSYNTTDGWVSRPGFPGNPSSYAVTLGADGLIYIIGGNYTDPTATKGGAFSMDPSTGVRTYITNLPASFPKPSAVLSETGGIYVFGGGSYRSTFEYA